MSVHPRCCTGHAFTTLFVAVQLSAGRDNRVLIIATLFLPVVGWVGFNILGPALNQLKGMQVKNTGQGSSGKTPLKKRRSCISSSRELYSHTAVLVAPSAAFATVLRGAQTLCGSRPEKLVELFGPIKGKRLIFEIGLLICVRIIGNIVIQPFAMPMGGHPSIDMHHLQVRMVLSRCTETLPC